MKVCTYLRMLASVAAAAILTAGCTKPRFTVEFQLPESVWGNYEVSYYASPESGEGFWIHATVPLEGGRAALEGATQLPTLVYVSSPHGSNQLVLLAERGDKLVISGAAADQLQWNVSGNGIDQRWSQWRASLADSKLPKTTSVEDYVSSHPDDPLSALLLITEYPRKENPEGFVRLWDSLGSKSRKIEMARASGSPDFTPEGIFALDSKGNIKWRKQRVRIKSYAYRAPGKRTAILGAGVPSLLYFYRRDDAGYEAAIDSVRSLVKSYPDSAKRHLALISLDADSVTWMARFHSDSLRKVSRGWVPLAEADTRLRSLGVRRSPWVIVTDREGLVTYSGSGIEGATADFRNQMHRTSDN